VRDTRYILDEKRTKYLAAITEWEKERTHNLLDTQRLYGKLLHATLVIPAVNSNRSPSASERDKLISLKKLT
jgi:hypothetical protein